MTSTFAGDPGNDEISYPVSVKDYYDIVMDMHWLDSDGNSVSGATEGTDSVDFKLTLEIVGSMDDVEHTKCDNSNGCIRRYSRQFHLRSGNGWRTKDSRDF